MNVRKIKCRELITLCNNLNNKNAVLSKLVATSVDKINEQQDKIDELQKGIDRQNKIMSDMMEYIPKTCDTCGKKESCDVHNTYHNTKYKIWGCPSWKWRGIK